MRALLQGTRDHLRQQLGLDDRTCEVTFNGQPPPWAGEEWWSVYQRAWRGNHGDYDLDEYYDLEVCYTRRLNGIVPWDRAGVQLLLKYPDGIYARVESARVKLHLNYDLMALANDLIEDPANKFVEPYKVSGIGPPTPQRASWFHAKAGSKDAGISMTISLSPARRVQTISSMT